MSTLKKKVFIHKHHIFYEICMGPAMCKIIYKTLPMTLQFFVS